MNGVEVMVDVDEILYILTSVYGCGILPKEYPFLIVNIPAWFIIG